MSASESMIGTLMVAPAEAPRPRALPDFARASPPPPGLSTNLTAFCVLGVLLAVLLFMHGGSAVAGG